MPPFTLLGESYGVARMGMARIFGLCFAFLFASAVAASTIDVGPSDWRNYGPNASHTTQGVRSSFGQSVRLPPTISGPTRVLPVSRNPVIPYGSIANGAKNFLRVSPQSAAASAAITALFLGLDWAFDDEHDSWMKWGALESPPVSGGWYYDVNGNHGPFDSAEDSCQHLADNYRTFPSGAHIEHLNPATNNRFSCRIRENSGSRRQFTTLVYPSGLECPAGGTLDPVTGACLEPGYIDLDPADWTELETSLPSQLPQRVSDAAKDIQTRIGAPLPGYTDTQITGPSSVTGPETTSTSTDPVTGDTTVTTTSTQTGISYGDTTITTTNTTTSTTYQNGQETDTTVTTETPGELPVSSGGGAAGEWPGFCDWATVVCDWLNWTQEDPPPEQDLPALVDDDFYTERDISFGSKSCPEPYQVNLAPFMDTQVSVSFQPLCDFAGLIYYMVMAASYIIAAYISIGVARA